MRSCWPQRWTALPRLGWRLYTFRLMLKLRNQWFVFTFLLMIRVIVIVILVRWVFLYSLTVCDYRTYITVNILFMAYVNAILDANCRKKWDRRQNLNHDSSQGGNSPQCFCNEGHRHDCLPFTCSFPFFWTLGLNSPLMVMVLLHPQSPTFSTRHLSWDFLGVSLPKAGRPYHPTQRLVINASLR